MRFLTQEEMRDQIAAMERQARSIGRGDAGGIAERRRWRWTRTGILAGLAFVYMVMAEATAVAVIACTALVLNELEDLVDVLRGRR